MEWVHRYMKWWYDSQKPPRRIEVLDWRPVMMWTWDIAIENCGICRNHIYDLCVECQANQVTAADRYGFKKNFNHGSSLNHLVKILGIFDPLPPLWS